MNETPKPAEEKRCAICGKPRDPKYTPFCSKRCADLDLGRWLNGSYVIPGRPVEGEEDDAPGTAGLRPAGGPKARSV